MTKSPDGFLHKRIRVPPALWERIERAAEGSPHSSNQVLVELAMEALDRRECPTPRPKCASRGPRCSPPKPSRVA